MRRFLIYAVLLLTACGAESKPPLVASEVVITAPMPGMTMSAAYMSLTNNSDHTISVSRVASPQFKSVALHETQTDNGVARMRALPRLDIPAGETVTLQRGGKHLMLRKPSGDAGNVSLEFFDGDMLLLTVDAAYKSRDN